MKMFTAGSIITAMLLLLPVIECTTNDERKLMQIVHQSLMNTAGIGPHETVGQQQQYHVQNDTANQIIRTLQKHTIVRRATKEDNIIQNLFPVTHNLLKFDYWNSRLGQKTSIRVEFGNEKEIIKHWIRGQPLKIIVHGWIRTNNDIEIVNMTSGYIATGCYNVITIDWSRVSYNIVYPIPAYLTMRVGTLIAGLLKNIVNLGLIYPSGIHLIGHSLGAHICGAIGSAFGPGKIGRITGLDPAGIGFEMIIIVQFRHLNVNDAQFVDVIHTSAGTIFGFAKPLGHADFYVNLGTVPQPGCKEDISLMPFSRLSQSLCSHSRACQYYTDSIYNGRSFMAVQCPSAKDYISGRCKNNTRNFMGNDVDFKKKGKFYLDANTDAPYVGIRDIYFDYLGNIKKIHRIT